MIKTINLNKTVKWAVASLLVISLQGFLIADDNDKVGSVAFKFLNIETDARTAALGGTSAQASGAGAMFSNPAGLSGSSMGLSAGMSQWLVDTDIMSVGVAMPIAGGVIGIGAVSVDYGDMMRSGWDETDGQFVFVPNQGSFKATDMSMQLSYGKSLSDKFSIGVSAKTVSQTIDDVDISGMAFDLGMQFNTGFSGIQMGAVISNFGPDVKSQVPEDFPSMSLPMTFSFGVIGEAIPGLNAGVNVLKQADMTQQYIVNAEYNISIASLRFSYNINDDQAPMSMGGGVNVAGADIGVSMTSHDALDSVMRISVGYSF
ncbi:MAG TPA: PorV/PorQ family protein [Candidatus Marinimicrobia bacterium]|jgi:hypothetical protein|nr:hypothetical protein [Candidatus Neomarinimicrobiota bacterium]MDP6275660.1 PorV/PorQ family protein [Candidatus Neomarinimicrobiota bacterium]MDP7216819.1 PorV/PorQ family protein [Candidatus Neomarinimicrobiota bacterium]MDP7437620.1 PorV/PorQ family protein [Candidatus Neomarinimicrobiota bacterium]HBN44870.1 hypothetical protein [Candidatus Neomarinimicrobiota bacterium]|tara:strand:+ start:5368 stop:6315 length:948 start_codon:yes stop_codon:yes gene_type:complete